MGGEAKECFLNAIKLLKKASKTGKTGVKPIRYAHFYQKGLPVPGFEPPRPEVLIGQWHKEIDKIDAK